MTASSVRRIVLALVLALTVTLVGAVPASAAPPRHERHCINPDGVDLNELHGINKRIVTDFCPITYSGEQWIPAAAWITNTTHEVIPAGYVPSRPTPIEDFNAKVVSVRYVIDEGTRRERTYRFPAREVLHTGGIYPGPDLPITGILAVLKPVSIGTHTVDIYVTLSADHWDGFDTIPEEDLIPAGENLWTRTTFDVRPAAERTD